MKIFYFYPTEVETQFVPQAGEPFVLYGKPILGGIFGFGQYVLLADVYERHRLPAVRYMVCERHSGHPISESHDTARAALAQARQIITAAPPSLIFEHCSRYLQQKRALLVAREDRLAQEKAASDAAEAVEVAERIKSISKKRRQIFESSDGKCHYCAVELTIQDTWHVEHKLPRSKGGTDLPDNLVAACAGCNIKKGRRTAEEFLAEKPKI